MPVIQHYTDSNLRNFSYITYCSLRKLAIIIDPFEGEEVDEVLIKNNLRPVAIVNTHDHWDHTCGNKFLTDKYNLDVIYQEGYLDAYPGITKSVKSGDSLELGDEHILTFLSSPGHTESHLTIILKDKLGHPQAVFSGDTLFNAGVGNCRNGGNVHQLYRTIESIYDEFEDSLIVYPGHDYLENNLNFTLSLEENSHAKKYLNRIKGQKFNSEPLSFKEERLFNLFLRQGRQRLKKDKKFCQNTDEQIFVELRKKRDVW